jgi:predicted nuclease with RNAse H fold
LSQPDQTVVGIDVGGKVKGFHAVALRDNAFVDKTSNINPAIIVDWCLAQGSAIVAVDAPCGWSQSGPLRSAKQELELQGSKIYCFATPTRKRAENNEKGFYDWVFNGERLYCLLVKHYPLFKGERKDGSACFETFPQAVTCFMEGRIIPAKHKLTTRRQALKQKGYDISTLSNIDFVDAALCAVAADEFRKNNYRCFGNAQEGFIVVPVYHAY